MIKRQRQAKEFPKSGNELTGPQTTKYLDKHLEARIKECQMSPSQFSVSSRRYSPCFSRDYNFLLVGYQRIIRFCPQCWMVGMQRKA